MTIQHEDVCPGGPMLWETLCDSADVVFADVARCPTQFSSVLLSAAESQLRTGEGQ